MLDYWFDKLDRSLVIKNCKCDPKCDLSSKNRIQAFYRVAHVYFTLKKEKLLKQNKQSNSSIEKCEEILWFNDNI